MVGNPLMETFEQWPIMQILFDALDRRDLSQCALVSKTWHYWVMPLLWATVPDLSLAQQASFQQMVLEDYRTAIALDMRERRLRDLWRNNVQIIQEHCQMQQQLLQSGDCNNTNTRLCALMKEESEEIQAQMARFNAERTRKIQQRPPTALEKYGSYIRKTPDIPTLLTYLWPNMGSEPSLQHGQGRGGRAPSKYDMLRHFLGKCRNVHFPSLVITQAYIDDGYFLDDLVSLVLPSVQELVLDSLSLSFSDLRRILETPNTVHDLDISISRIYIDDKESHNARSIGNIRWFKEELLSLTISIQDQNQPAKFWVGLWRGCKSVYSLRVIDVVPGMVAALTRDVAIHMPCLTFLDLGKETEISSTLDFSDEDIATILEAGMEGWKSVQLRDTAAMGSRSLAILAQHYSTLEVLECCWSFRGEHLVDILSSCPCLNRLTCQIEDVRMEVEESFSPITVEQFIDWDEESLSYRPWACESELQTLQIVFVDLDQEDDGWELHAMFYDRLARLSKLEILHLGTVGDSQLSSCGIAMTLESGLSKLAGLKQLRILDLSFMIHQVTVQDLKWMVKNWPNLTKVQGLDPHEAEWLDNYWSSQ